MSIEAAFHRFKEARQPGLFTKFVCDSSSGFLVDFFTIQGGGLGNLIDSISPTF